MWCDDFDADLFKVIPEARGVLAPVRDVKLFTHSSLTNGKINCPSCWHTNMGLAAFFGFRDAAKPEHYSASHPLVPCTFEEAVRDLWVHGGVMLVERRCVWDASDEQRRMMTLMYHVRGVAVLDKGALAGVSALVLAGLAVAVERLQALQRQFPATAV